MKKAFFLTLLLVLLGSMVKAQTEIESLLIEQNAIEKGTPVKWNAEKRQLQIGRNLIPISGETHLQIDRNEDGKLVVEFLLQKGTAVTSLDDATFRRAYWAIPFQSRQACRRFISLLEKL